MEIKVVLTEKDLKGLILDHLSDHFKYALSEEDVKIEVKSKQNWKSEWEVADFRATVVKY